MKKIELKRIPGFSKYKISNCGDVWSDTKNKFLKPFASSGHECIDLIDDFGQRKKNRVHRLVMLAFVGEPPNGKNDDNHKDGNKRNNFIDNLEYCSRSYNIIHRYRSLNYQAPNGIRDHALTDEEIDKIRLLRGQKRKDRKYKYTINRLAEMFDVVPQTIMCIIYYSGVYKNRGSF